MRMIKRAAILSMDVEDWYHLDYIDRDQCDRSQSLLDGYDVFLDFLLSEKLPATFFALGELASGMAERLRRAATMGHEVASHGWNHKRPLTLSPEQFLDDIRHSKHALEQAVGVGVQGYRAPCFSLDRHRLDVLPAAGYHYDSSRITFSHPLYGMIDMSGFLEVRDDVYVRDDFCEFEVSTGKIGHRHVPISGGGYLRMFPWLVMRTLLRSYLRESSIFTLYIHPFELSPRPAPQLPASTSFASRRRFSLGRNTMLPKLKKLVAMLRRAGFEFTTFRDLRTSVIPLPSARRHVESPTK